jgi:hypothetical protein
VVVRIVALERESKGRWVEIDITDQRRQTLVMKTLLEGTLAKPKRVLKTVVQPPGLQPLLLPSKLAAKKLPKVGGARDPSLKLVGKVKVKVAAGTFSASHYRKEEKGEVFELWSSDDVPAWPMVKARTPKVVLELAGYGKGGRSRIRGKPGKLDPQLLKRLGLDDSAP